MTTPYILLLVGVGLAAAALAAVPLICWFENRQDRILNELWAEQPGAVDLDTAADGLLADVIGLPVRRSPDVSLFDWAADTARDDWSRKA